MPSTTTLTGTYTATVSGVLRTLVITSQNTTSFTIAGTWTSQINGVAATFPVAGGYVLGGGGNPLSPTIYLSLWGSAQVTAPPGGQPPTMRAVSSITGYCEPTGATPAGVDQLLVTVSWGQDMPGRAKNTGAWSVIVLNR
jgi:hypothetical protein